MTNLELDFDGETFDPALDRERLNSCLDQVRFFMLHPRGQWWTLEVLAKATGARESGVSARIRDLRKEKHGGYDIESRRVEGGLWQYRIRAKGGDDHAL